MAEQTEPEETTLRWHRNIYEKWFIRILFLLAVVGLHFASLTVNPPPRLPYLFHLLMAGFSFAYNCYFLVLANLLQCEWLYTEVLAREKKAL